MLTLVVYNDNNNKTISKLYIGLTFLEPGQTNGFGWEVITIQELYNKQFYLSETISKMILEEREEMEKYNSLINKIIHFIDIIINA